MRKITQKHIDVCLRILAKDKNFMKEKLQDDYDARVRNIEEMEYCEKLVKVLYEDYEILRKQPKLI